MKHTSQRVHSLFIIGVLTASSLFFLGWGSVGHKWINQNGANKYAVLSLLSSTIIQQVTNSASAPDSRSGSQYEPNHFMDMDALAEFPTHSITHNLDSLFLKYGENYIRADVGYLPWVIDSVTTVLTNHMRTKNWNAAWITAADLGHYIGDAHNPLHTTKYYNGNTGKYGSASNGIHSRYESTMISSYSSSLTPDTSKVYYITSPLKEAFEIMYLANSYVDSVYTADQYARGYASTGSTLYTDLLWAGTKNFTIQQFRRAAMENGSYLYTAWVNAGSPSTGVEQTSVRVECFNLYQNYPNPFNPSTTIRYWLPFRCHVTLNVYNSLGEQILRLVDEQQNAGEWQATWNAEVSSGIYFYRLTASSGESSAQHFEETRKMVLLR